MLTKLTIRLLTINYGRRIVKVMGRLKEKKNEGKTKGKFHSLLDIPHVKDSF